MNNKRSVNFVAFAITVMVMASIGFAQTPSGNEVSSMENRYFKLDFSDSSYDMSDIENQFFTTYPHDDPTQGDIVYDRVKWVNKDMFKLVNGDGLYLYIKDRNDGKSFDSFRLTSKSFYNINEENKRLLFVFKGQLPSAKGIWPAWWLNGSVQDEWTYEKNGRVDEDADLDKFSGKGRFYNTRTAVNSTDWPSSGEIDIIETINGVKVVHNTIHTCPQMCDSEWNSDGQIINCANSNSLDPNPGCSGKPYTVDSVEGTFACLWENKKLTFYYWAPKENVREDGGPLSAKPTPDKWTGDNLKNQVRLLETDTECDNARHQEWQCTNCEGNNTCNFRNMKMIFNITLCGSWAGNKFDETKEAWQNCKSYIVGEGKKDIDNQFIKIEYLSVSTY
ncbi:MAG: hypothetical protein ACRBF0_25280 [Calditrichia bacterium]